MGRQAHLTRLAFGRSPYGDPLRDENGDFVMSSRASVYNNVGYEQDFDERGHPRNIASTHASRRFRRAQNNVLVAVGVVARKGEAQKSEWEMLKVKDKARHIMKENEEGKLLKGIDRVLGAVSLWSCTALRRRIMTFDPYYRMPLTDLIGMEWSLIGFRRFMTAGLPLCLLSFPPQLYRHYVREPDVEDTVNYVDPSSYALGLYEKCTFALVHIPCFMIELPIQVYAVLQSLFIIRPDTLLNLSFFIPFTSASPISFPSIPRSTNFTGWSAFAVDCIHSPFMLSMIREYLHIQIGYRLYALLRQVLVRPEHPDPLSAKASDEKEDLDDTSIPGIGRTRTTEDIARPGRYFGPRSFMGALRIAFPPIYNVLNFLNRGKLSLSRGRLDVEFEERLQIRVRSAYCGRLRLTGEAPTPGSIADISLRREVMYTVFAALSLDPDEELVDPYAWADAVLQDVVTLSSNSTPDPRELFDFAETIRDEARNLALPNGTAEHEEVQRLTENLELNAAEPLLRTENERNESETPGVADPSNNTNNESAHTEREEIVQNDSEVQEPIVNVVETTLSGSSYANTTHVIHGDVLLNSTAQSPALLDTIEESHNIFENGGVPQRLDDTSGSNENNRQINQMQLSNSDPLTPVQGISRAASLIDPDLTARPRRLRRPTEIDPVHTQNLLDINESLLAEGFPSTQHAPSDTDTDERNNTVHRGSPPHGTGRDHSRYQPFPRIDKREWRVTLLSTFAADSLAWHGSAIITSFILWPLESLYLRSITTWFLHNPLLAGFADQEGILAMTNPVFGGGVRVFGMQEWFGGASAASGGSRSGYMMTVMLVLGLEAVGRGMLWYLGTRSVLKKGIQFGWGKF